MPQRAILCGKLHRLWQSNSSNIFANNVNLTKNLTIVAVNCKIGRGVNKPTTLKSTIFGATPIVTNVVPFHFIYITFRCFACTRDYELNDSLADSTNSTPMLITKIRPNQIVLNASSKFTWNWLSSEKPVHALNSVKVDGNNNSISSEVSLLSVRRHRTSGS